MNRFFGISPDRAAIVALLCCASALVSGCSTTEMIGPDTSPALGAAMQGKVIGGQNPISSATVQLWAVGSTGYGSAASKLGSSVTTNSSGFFTLGSYTCPSSTTQTFITSSGGNPGLGSGTNSNIMLAAGLGSCGNLGPSTVIVINEVTTAATAYALGQYFTPAVGGASSADSFGAPNTTQAQTGIVNAMATVNNLVTTSTGAAITSGSVSTSGGAGTLTTTPEYAKLYTVADILASCVNSAGGTAGDTSACGMLFDGVVSATGAAPTDTLQAAVYMSLNPTSKNTNTDWPTNTTCTNNICVLYGLVIGTPPFTAGSQPTDWTIGILYTDATATVLLAPQSVAVDASGNVWVVNNSLVTNATQGSLVELSPTGAPLQNLLNSATAGTGANTANPRNLAIDTAGNVWVPTSSGSGYVFEISSSGTTIGTSKLGGKAAYGIAIDGSNNVFVSQESTSATFTFGEFPGASGGANVSEYVTYPLSETLYEPEYLAFDTASPANLWATNGSAKGNVNYLLQVSTITPCTTEIAGTPCAAPTTGSDNTYTEVTAGSMAEPLGIAAGASGAIWTVDYATGTNSVTLLTSPTSGTAFGSSPQALNSPRLIAVDGAGDAWVTDSPTGATSGSGTGGVSEFSSTGTALSSTSGAVGYSHPGLNAPFGIAIDPSGNVWVANALTAASQVDPNSVFEIVGAAAPTVTPIALALKNSAVGAKP